MEEGNSIRTTTSVFQSELLYKRYIVHITRRGPGDERSFSRIALVTFVGSLW